MTPLRIIVFAGLSAFLIVATASMAEAAGSENLGFADPQYAAKAL